MKRCKYCKQQFWSRGVFCSTPCRVQFHRHGRSKAERFIDLVIELGERYNHGLLTLDSIDEDEQKALSILSETLERLASHYVQKKMF